MLKQTQLDNFMRLLNNEKQCSNCKKWVQRNQLQVNMCGRCYFHWVLDKTWAENQKYLDSTLLGH